MIMMMIDDDDDDITFIFLEPLKQVLTLRFSLIR